MALVAVVQTLIERRQNTIKTQIMAKNNSTLEEKAVHTEDMPRAADAPAESGKSEAKNRLEREAARILADYPDSKEVCMTADGFGFFREQDARNHADTLRDKSILTVKRK